MDGKHEKEERVEFRRGGKYRNSAKTLLPYRKKKTTGHPADNAGCFSTFLFSWMTGLVWKLHKTSIPVENLWQAPESDQAVPNAERLLRLWKEELQEKGDQASMKRTIFRFLRTRLYVTIFCVIGFVMCQFASNGVIVRYLLRYIEEYHESMGTGLVIVGGMLLAEVLRAMFFSFNFAVSLRNGVRLRSAVTTVVFEKVLRVPPTVNSNIGEIVNLCSSDGDRLFEATYLCALLVTAPITFLAGAIYLCILVGPIALTGCGVFIFILFFQVILMKLLNYLRQKAVFFTDKRVKAINEVLSSIKLIKMYAWEESFTKVVHHIRNQERKILQNAMFVLSLNMSIAGLSPYVATVTTLGISAMLGNNITSSEAFTCFSLFHVMSFSLKIVPVALKQVAEGFVAAERIQNIIQRKEFSDYLKPETSSPDIAIEMTKATLSWPIEEKTTEKKEENGEAKTKDNEMQVLTESTGNGSVHQPNCLTNITLEVAKGSLVGICGRVGSGKSSLISGLLGHLKLNDGTVAVRGTSAFCAQDAWIMNASIRDNITFGMPYIKSKYDRIVEACCLLPDFDILQSGDMTEVGERGVNMSGGQKQRINIARSIYMDKDIYLLDDPLSAVDAHVGKALFENAITGCLKKAGKTVVLVTHRLEYLPYCDQVTLIKDGQIWETGSHDDLMDDGADYYQLYKMWSKEKKETEADEINEDDPSHSNHKMKSSDLEEDDAKRAVRGRLMTIEEKAEGAVEFKTYAKYIKGAGGFFIYGLVILLFACHVICQQFTTLWLSYWLKQGSGNVKAENFTTTPSGLSIPNPSAMMNTSSLPDVSNISEPVSMEIFTTPITSSFSNTENTTVYGDFGISPGRVIDNPHLYFYLSVFGYAIAVTVCIIILKSYLFSEISLKAAHKLHNKLLDKIIHGTMEFFDTTPTGRILNRFQKDQDMMDTIIPLLLDMVITFGIFIISCVVFIAYVFPYFLFSLVVLVPIFLVAFTMFKGSVREMKRQDNMSRSPWISHITTTISGIHTVCAYKREDDFLARFHELLNINTIPFFLYVSINRWLVTRLDFMTIAVIAISSFLAVLLSGTVPPSYAALAVTSALMTSTLFQFTVRTAVEVDANSVCMERITHYIDTVPQEPKAEEKRDLDKKWPQFGSVRFVNVKMRYRDGLPLVLQDISFTINTCEKIGVVGRTGSGKSSLGVALFRLVELSGGAIEIDGVNTAELSLKQLRSKISIIPQEPVLFTGTVKYNVDPFEQYSDEEIWQALERTHLKEVISNLPLKLEAPVSENGGNFSVGERQLMCLTRALLRHNKILVLDEATASIDARTDRLVQETINEHFADCTLITIAHRLHTVLTCDKIMVLDDGSLKEFDTPDNLSKNPNSLFSKLLKSTNV